MRAPARGPSAATRYPSLATFGSRTPPAPRNLGVPFPPQGPSLHAEVERGGRGPVRRPHPRAVGPEGPGYSLLLPSRSGLVEIRAVALRTVAIKGVHSVRYLCMGADGRMRGLVGVSPRGYAPVPRRSLAGRGGRCALNRIQGFLALAAGSGTELGREDGKGPD